MLEIIAFEVSIQTVSEEEEEDYCTRLLSELCNVTEGDGSPSTLTC